MNTEIKILLSKYTNNRCTADELAQVKAILQSGLYQEEWLSVMEDEATNDVIDGSDVTGPGFDTAKVFARINESTAPIVKRYPYKWAIGLAATLLISLSAGYLLLHNNYTSKQQDYIAKQVTHAGERKIITLTDGSTVVLNNRSELRYSSHFSGNKREVYLKGEAFFEVKHDTARPFIVHTAHLKVQVLGTSFNVKSYQNDNHTTVGVVTGKVGVNGNKTKRTFMLLPGNVLSCDKRDTAFQQLNLTTDEILGWQKGLMAFHQETLEEIIPELERWYDVSVTLNSKQLLKKRITASFSRKPLNEVLEILSKTAGFTYVINKNQVQIN